MSEKTSPASELSAPFPAETQTQRWLKYGSNVVLTSLVVVALAVCAVYLAQRYNKQVDMTSTGLYSLKPQTINIIKNNKQHIKIIAFYTTQKPPQENTATAETDPVVHFDPAVEAQTVADLLQEYKEKGSNIDVESIDPNQNPGRVDALVDEAMNKYSGEIKAYKAYIADAGAQYNAIKDLIQPGLEQLGKLPYEEFKSLQLRQAVQLTLYSIQDVPSHLDEQKKDFAHLLSQNVPDYKGVTTGVESDLADLSVKLSMVMGNFKLLKDEQQIPEAIRKYMADQLPIYEKAKKIADDLLEKAKTLGDLKLDKLRTALRQTDPIIVEGEHDWEVESHDAIWQVDQEAAHQLYLTKNMKTHPRFAGEEVLTSEIYGMQITKHTKVCFIRAGGWPLTWPAQYRRSPISFAEAAYSLSQRYHFDVLDKDMTNSWAYLTQGRAPPEPKPEEIKDAIWIVFSDPNQRNPTGMGPSTIAPYVAEHIANGGSALIMTVPGGENYDMVLHDWGISVLTDYLCAHEVTQGKARSTWYDEALRHPEYFQLTQYGDVKLVQPLQSLNMLLAGICPVETRQVKGVANKTFLPIPDEPEAPKSWAMKRDTNVTQDAPPKYDPSLGDKPGPLFGAALAEKAGGQRIAVFGTPTVMFDQIIETHDMDAPNQPLVYPGNLPLVENTIFWLAHKDELIAISPLTDAGRIRYISPYAQVFWRYGVLLILLPGLMLVCGLTVYLVRRD